MKKIEVSIEGTSPLLMHAIGVKAMESMMKKSKKTVQNYDPKEDAEDAAYRMKSGELHIPARCMKACIVNASAWYKMGRRSAKQYVAGATLIEPVEIPLGTKKYEIDLRPVVIQRARVIRARPKLEEWGCQFRIVYNQDIFSDTGMLKQIVEEAGIRIGVLDNRPQKGGENGAFKITGWKI